ncbi:hypothetical protein MHIR_DE00093 [Candidatus Doolittlea endobia]|uniref:Uncharacterized protein n=1 Tax=Candidatus Doolittlea endobia TaxID=1778262 RepID=A0A143WRV6_9ENTR|nr:hypothetical protein MHIR_DE00093 [Candidatus Doolittlea endobia]
MHDASKVRAVLKSLTTRVKVLSRLNPHVHGLLKDFVGLNVTNKAVSLEFTYL